MTKGSPTCGQDFLVFKEIFDAYIPVGREKRNEAAAHENSLARLGRGSKENAGRTFSVEEWGEKCKFLAKLVTKNGINPIMAKIGDAARREEVVKMCLDVLGDGGGGSMGTRTDENHLYPEEIRDKIEEVVTILAEAGVSAEDLERFSCSLHIVDSLTSACLRPQDSLGCLACGAYIKKGSLVFRLPPVGKNSASLLRNAAGMVVHHKKAKEIEGGSFLLLFCSFWC